MSIEGPDYAAPKLRQWQMSRPGLSGRFPMLPKITIEDIPEAQRDRVKQWYYTRDWERCDGPGCRRSGSDFKLKKCAGCGTSPLPRTYYCSKSCQRAAWPNHQDRCQQGPRFAELGRIEAFRDKIDFSIWSYSKTAEAKRAEGLAIIGHWVFSQLFLSCPQLSLRKVALTIHCHSSRQGRGSIVPFAYQLEPMTQPVFEWAQTQAYRQSSVTKTGIIIVSIDRVNHFPQCVEFTPNLSPHLIEQWPWIFATIVSMRSYSRQLAIYRLQHLYPLVEQLAMVKRPEVLHFRVPKNLDNGKLWELYDFPKWQMLFGDVISF